MRIIASLLFAFAALSNVLPAAAHGAGVSTHLRPPTGCFPWSGCRK